MARAGKPRCCRSWATLAAAAKLLGFAGIAFDQEMYPQQGGAQTATWEWDYPGNTHSEAEVREQARRRGAEAMDEILAAFPKAEFAVYHAFFPGDWRELIQEEVNGLTNTSTDRLDIDFWNGMTSVEGYGAIRFFDSVFYKGPHKGNWDSALTYNQNRAYATFSRRFSNWDYAWSRVKVSPFAWIDDGPKSSSFDDARPPAYVGEQLLAFRKWGMGGEFANFVYAPLDELRLLALRERDAERLQPGRSRRRGSDARGHEGCQAGPIGVDRGHRSRQPRDPRRASGRTTAVARGSPTFAGRCSRATTTPAISGGRGGRSPPAR